MTSPFTRLFPDEPQRPVQRPESAALDALFPDDTPKAVGQLEALSRNPIADPATMGESVKLGRSLNLPTDVVARNFKTVQPLGIAEGVDWKRFIEDAPKTARWLEDPINHALASDDTARLGRLERLARSKFVQDFGGAFAGARQPGLMQVNPMQVPSAEPIPVGVLREEWRRGQLVKERGHIGSYSLAEQQRPEVQARLREIEEALAEPMPEAEGFAQFVRGTTRILPGMTASMMEGTGYAGAGATVGAILGSMTGPAAPVAIPAFAAAGAKVGLVFGGVQETARQIGGNLSLDLQQDGVDPTVADIAGRTAGWLGGGVEYSNVFKVLAPFQQAARRAAPTVFGRGTAAALTRPTVQSVLIDAGKYYGTTVGTEIAEENIQQAIEALAGRAAYAVSGIETDPLTAEGVLQGFIDTTTETFIAMALLPIPGTALVGANGLARIDVAMSRKAGMEQAIAEAKDSPLRKRDPEAFRDVVREQTDAQVVYVDGEVISALLQENNVPPEQFVERAGISMQDYQQAVEQTGTELALPVDALLANLADTPLAGPLLPHIRFELGGMTAREAEAALRDMDAFRAKVAEEAEAVGDIEETDPAWRVVEDLRQKLEATGTMTPDQANLEAQLAAKPYVAWARAIASTNPESPLADPWNVYTMNRPLTVVSGARAEAQFDAEMAVARARRLGRTQDEIDALRARVTRLADERVAVRKVLEEAEQVLDVRDEEGRLQKSLRFVSTDALVQEYIRLRDVYQQASNELANIEVAIEVATDGRNVQTAEEQVGVIEEADVAKRVPEFGDVESWSGKIAAYNRYLRSLRSQAQKVERSIPRLGRELELRGVTNPDQYAVENNLEGTFAVPTGEVPFQTASIREGRETLKRYGLDPNKRYTNRQVAQALEKRQREKYGTIAKNDRSPEARWRIARWMAEEVEFEMRTPEQSGVGWYSEKYQAGLDELGTQFPELLTGGTVPNGQTLSRQDARDLFTALVAVASDGADVADNMVMAVGVYRNFRETGTFELQRGHNRKESVAGNLQDIARLYNELGVDGMRAFLLETRTVSDLKKIAKSRGEKFETAYQVSMEMPMAVIVFGEKLGAFYANLMGQANYLTMDRWWSRTFNRYRGQLLPEPTEQGIMRFRDLLEAERREVERETGRKQPQIDDNEIINGIVKYRNDYAAKGFKKGTEIEQAANTLYKAIFDELNDIPFTATDRTFMIDTVREARKLLARRGINMTPADLQATLWYYEKKLYGQLTGTKRRSTEGRSYADAVRNAIAVTARGRTDGGVTQGVPVGRDAAERVAGEPAVYGDESSAVDAGSAPFAPDVLAQMDGVEMLLQAAFHGSPYTFERQSVTPQERADFLAQSAQGKTLDAVFAEVSGEQRTEVTSTNPWGTYVDAVVFPALADASADLPDNIVSAIRSAIDGVMVGGEQSKLDALIARDPAAFREAMRPVLDAVKQQIGPTITLYRGVNPDNIAVQGKPFEYWAPTRQMAQTFAGRSARGFVAERTVNVDDVLGAYATMTPDQRRYLEFYLPPSRPADFLAQEPTAEVAPQMQALHNLSADNLRFAAEMGGLAVPSLGVTREGMSFEGMGEITLLGTREMADPSRTPVYTADAYTVTFPRPEYKRARSKDALALYRKFQPESRRFDDSLANEISDNATAGRPDRSIELMLRSPAAIAVYLSERGETFNPVLSEDPSRIDRFATRTAALDAIAGREVEYKSWVEAQVLPMHGDPFLTISRKKVPYTLDNIVRAMKGKGAAVEKTITFGVGKTRAASARRLKDLNDMRRRSFAIGTAEEVNIGRKESEALLSEYRTAVIDYHEGSTWDSLDASMRAIARAAKGTPIKTALEREGFRNVPQDVLDLGTRAMQAMLAAPVPYFEAKVQRAVGLEEFGGAVIPSDAPQDVRQILLDAGVPVAEYNASEPATRNAAITQLASEQQAAGVDVLFQREQRPNAFFIRRERVIGLMKTSNLSSFLHEMSHDYLGTLQVVASNPDAPDWLRQDFETALTHIGVKPEDRDAFVQYLTTGQGRSNAETKAFVAAEERWARSFESYLEKGKAPSRDLERAFANFRVWLGQIYKKIKELLIPVSPELRGVFDRMLATDEEIASYRETVEARPLFSEQPPTMTDAQWAEYTKGFRTRDALLGGELAKRVLAEQRAAVDRDWQARRDVVEAGIREELAQEPIVQAVAFLRDGVDGTPMKLNRALLNGLAPDLWKSLPKGTTAADGTMTLDAVALKFGFPTETELVAELQRYEEVDAIVQRRLTEAFRREYGDLLGDSTAMADAVSEVTHRPEADEPVVRELKALGRQLGMRPVNKPALAQVAKDMIAGMRVADIQPHKYEQAEAREAKLAEQALRKGEPERAAFHKRRQLLNRILVREARSALAESEKIQAFALRMSGETAQARLGKAGQSLQDAMNAVLDDYEFATVSRKRIERRSALAAYVAYVTERGGVPMISEETLQDARIINYRSLTLDELRGVDATMRQIYHHAKTIDTIAKEGRRVSLAQAEEAIVASLQRHRPDTEMDLEGFPLSLAYAKERAIAIDAWHVPPTFLFRWLDGDNYGETWNTLYAPLKDAEDAELKRLEDASRRAKEIDKMVDLPLVDRPKRYDGIRTPMTRQRIYALASNWGNALSRTAVLEAKTGDGYPQFGSAAAIEAMFAETMTAKDWAYIQARWDYLNEFWPEIAELERRLSGITPDKVESTPFTIATADGTTTNVAGGYYPLSYDRNLGRGTGLGIGKAMQDVFESDLGSIQLVAGARAQTQHGWTNNRVGSAGNPIDLSMGVWNKHVTGVIHDLTHRESVRDVYALLTRPGMREAIVRAAGLPYYDAMMAWLIRVANPNAMVGDASYIEKLGATARVGTTVVNLGLKFSTGVAQTLGYLQSVEAIGPKWMAVGMRELLSQRGKAVDAVMQSSAVMRNRRYNFNRDMADYARSKFGKLTNADAFSFWFIGMMDGMVGIPTWIGAYRKAMQETGNDHAQAVRIADDTVENTQGAGSPKDLARIQGGPEMRRLLTMHYTAFSRMYGQFRRARTNLQIGKYGLPRFAAAMTLLWFGQVVLSELMSPGDKDEEDNALELWLWRFASFPPSLIVGLRDVIRGVGPEPWDYKATPAEAAFETSIKAVNAIYRETLGDLFYGADRELSEAEAKALIEAPGYWFRLPSKAIWQYGDYLMDWMQGEVAPANPLEAARGMLLNRRQ